MRYSRQMLVEVVVEHQRDGAGGCDCGWSVPGASHAEHIADCYEAGMGGTARTATWEDAQELCRKLGHDPDTVSNIRLEPSRLVYVEVMHNLRSQP